MADGLARVAVGPWRMADGLARVAVGPWRMADGLARVVVGRRMADGLARVVVGRRMAEATLVMAAIGPMGVTLARVVDGPTEATRAEDSGDLAEAERNSSVSPGLWVRHEN